MRLVPDLSSTPRCAHEVSHAFDRCSAKIPPFRSFGLLASAERPLHRSYCRGQSSEVQQSFQRPPARIIWQRIQGFSGSVMNISGGLIILHARRAQSAFLIQLVISDSMFLMNLQTNLLTIVHLGINDRPYGENILRKTWSCVYIERT